MDGRAILRRAGWLAMAPVRRKVRVPGADVVPEGRVVDLPGRGRTFVVDVPGPTPDAPTVVLLHALGCTAYLSWYPTFAPLARNYRVLTFDQRWHGRGIRSDRFRFADCADDVVAVLDALGIEQAIIAGYSMGGAIAQLTWQRNPERVAGLVLCSTARNFRGKSTERFFFRLLTGAMHPLSRYALLRVERYAQTLPEMPSVDVADTATWGRAEFRSTSAWSMPEVLGELGRFNSASWIGEVDVPTAVVVTERDRAIPARRQRRLAASIPRAHEFLAPAGHASLVLDAQRWVPVFMDAVDRVRDEHAATALAK
jgi:pimeloyl-ACP methyl ester carboxylesterase